MEEKSDGIVELESQARNESSGFLVLQVKN